MDARLDRQIRKKNQQAASSSFGEACACVMHKQAQLSPASRNTKFSLFTISLAVCSWLVWLWRPYVWLSVAVALWPCARVPRVAVYVACGLRLVAASGLNVGHGKPGAHRPPVVSIILYS
jgi:hypothetical protein